MPANVLIVEDETAIVDFLRDNLRQDEHRVTAVGTARDAIRRWPPSTSTSCSSTSDSPTAPASTSFRAIRGGEAGDPGIGVIVLTARTEEQDQLRGFQRGADDYVAKPFGYPELLARIVALHDRLRRATRRDVIAVGEVEIDVLARSVRVAGTPIALPAKEFELLATLARDPERVIPEGGAAGADLGLPQQPHDADARQPRVAAAAADRGCPARHEVHRQPLGRRVRAPRRRGLMRRVLANRLVLAVAVLSVAVSTAFGAFVVLPVNELADAAHAASVADRADLALAVLRAGGRPTARGLAVLSRPSAAASGVPSAADWARANESGWRHDARSGRTAYAIRPVGDGRLVVVSAVRPGTFERRERLGLAGALCTVLIGAMSCALHAGTRHARRLARLARVARRIAAGDLTARAHDRGRDEIARLGADVDLMAERLGALERARGEFVAKVSHDLRTPVTVIKGYAYTLARRSSDPDVERRLAAITREADRLAAQIDDLLTLSSSRAGALELVWRPAETGDLLADIAERAAAQAAERGVDLEVDGVSFTLDGDHARLARAVTNLVQNAIRHAPAGSVVVLRAEADGDDAVLVVDDEGCGIPPERIPALLQPFATGDPIDGTGLGLAIVAEIAAAHGGTFSLDPRPTRRHVGAHSPARLRPSPDGVRMRRRVLVAAAAVLAVAAGALSLRPSSPARAGAGDVGSVPVLVARRTLAAGRPIDPGQVAIVRMPAALTPRAALSEVDQAAFRIAAVPIPVGLPIVPSLLRRGAGTSSLAPGERAVGVRVDDVTGLPALLDAGSAVDLVIGTGASRLTVAAAGVLGRPRRAADGSWAVALRLPARVAETVAGAQADGAEVRLLARGDAQ